MLNNENKEILANANQLRELFPMLNEAGREILMNTAAMLNTERYLKQASDIKVVQKPIHKRPQVVAVKGIVTAAPAEQERQADLWTAHGLVELKHYPRTEKYSSKHVYKTQWDKASINAFFSSFRTGS